MKEIELFFDTSTAMLLCRKVNSGHAQVTQAVLAECDGCIAGIWCLDTVASLHQNCYNCPLSSYMEFAFHIDQWKWWVFFLFSLFQRGSKWLYQMIAHCESGIFNLLKVMNFHTLNYDCNTYTCNEPCCHSWYLLLRLLDPNTWSCSSCFLSRCARFDIWPLASVADVLSPRPGTSIHWWCTLHSALTS